MTKGEGGQKSQKNDDVFYERPHIETSKDIRLFSFWVWKELHTVHCWNNPTSKFFIVVARYCNLNNFCFKVPEIVLKLLANSCKLNLLDQNAKKVLSL